MKDMDFDVYAKNCPSREKFEAIFSRWGILILGRLTSDPVRFGTLHRSIEGISEKMLAHTLKILEDEGLVSRKDWNEKPPRVEYALTAAGLKVAQGIKGALASLFEIMKDRLTQPER